MRVLHLLDHSVPLHSGYAFRTLSILREQRAAGVHTDQLTSTKHYPPAPMQEDVDGFTFHRSIASGGAWLWPVLEQLATVRDTYRRLLEVIESVKPDLLHAHSPCLNGIAAILAGRKTGLPVVYEMRASWEDAAVDHGTTTEGSARYQLSRAMETWVLRRADAITTICDGLRTDVISRGILASQVTVIPNGVDVEEFPLIQSANLELQRQLGLEGHFVIGFIGSFYGYEGLDVLIDAVPKILSFCPELRLLLVGGGREEARLVEQVRRLGLEKIVLMPGRVPHAEVDRYYSVIDLLAYPRKSIRLTETVTPLKPLEAMSQGRLLIASDVGGHRELIQDAQTGYLFKPDHPASIAEVVHRVMASRDAWPEIRRNGRSFVVNERTWQRSVSRYATPYAAALQKRIQP